MRNVSALLDLHHSFKLLQTRIIPAKSGEALAGPSWVTCPHSVSRVQAEEISGLQPRATDLSLHVIEGIIGKGTYLSIQSSLT